MFITSIYKKHLNRNSRVIVFGMGRLCERIRRETDDFRELFRVVAYTDNNSLLWNRTIGEAPVIPPEKINDREYDYVLVLISKKEEIIAQLIKLGIGYERIVTKELFEEDIYQNNVVNHYDCARPRGKEKVLIITNAINYDGSGIAAVNAAKILLAKGYEVVLSAIAGNNDFINELKDWDIKVVISPKLKLMLSEELEWVCKFDYAIINTIPMIVSAYVMSKIMPTIWWIHEADDRNTDIYMKSRLDLLLYAGKVDLSGIDIYGVSAIANNNFKHYYDSAPRGILPCGIEDDRMTEVFPREDKKKLCFAIIGGLYKLKGQDIFLDAVETLENEEKNNMEVWFIGKNVDKNYVNKIEKRIHDFDNVYLYGECSHEDMKKIYENIDVVVCASLEETLSLTVIEGMMYKKVCITTKNTGIAAYIQDGVDGFIVESGNVESLRNIIRHILSHRECIDEIGEQARKTYEKNFTLEKLGNTLEEALRNTKMF